jgi:hypothetical protein
MIKILAPIAIVLLSFTTIADEWKTITLLENVTVSLPGTPVQDNSKGVPVQTVTMADSTEISAVVIDFSTFGLTEELLQQMAGTDQFKQMIEAQAASQPGVKILKNEAGKFADKYVMYNSSAEVNTNEYKGTIANRTIIYKKYGISIMFKPGKKGVDEALKEKVFNSLKIAG